MEGVRVFSPEDWSGSGMDDTSYAAADLKKSLEGLAKHLFGTVCFPFFFGGGGGVKWLQRFYL
jgi:hypothetical protein